MKLIILVWLLAWKIHEPAAGQTSNVSFVDSKLYERVADRKNISIVKKEAKKAQKRIACKKEKSEFSTQLARSLYYRSCPKTTQNMVEPCPRVNWFKRNDPVNFEEKGEDGNPELYHYWFHELSTDTLYDSQPIYEYKTEEEPVMGRFHTCKRAEEIDDLHVETWGTGWIYFVWRHPVENCVVRDYFRIAYTSSNLDNETDTQNHVGAALQGPTALLHIFRKFHPCPRYPRFYCMIVSENVDPYVRLTFGVMYTRFGGERYSDDISNWTWMDFTTDDSGPPIAFCPPVNIFTTLWFLILTIILFLLLLLIAVILAALLCKRKKDDRRRKELEESGEYEEEPIGPTSGIGKVWERLRNFFKELCPRPSPPPPPPPEPPPKPKKKKPKKKKKKVPKPKAKKKKKKKKAPKPPPPPPPKKKKKRGARAQGKKRSGAALDPKKEASSVGGVRGRRRR